MICEACDEEFQEVRTWQKYCSKLCLQRNFDYNKNYGISLKQYNKMWADQEGCCAICKRHSSEFAKNLHVDHNHTTGEVRGLLCHNCNLALGRFYEDPEVLLNAIGYLRGR